MKRFLPSLLLIGAGVLSAASGCGETPPPPVDDNVEAKAKVEAMNKIAEAMAKDPNGMEVADGLEQFRVHPLDYQKNRGEAEAIVETYRSKIKGKYRGALAQEVQIEMQSLEIQVGPEKKAP